MVMSRQKTGHKSARKLDQATRTVVAILQDFGNLGFDIDGRSQTALLAWCDNWISHLMYGGRSPANSDLGGGWLDWPGVRDFVASERARERDHVIENTQEYKNLAISLLHNFSRVLHNEQDSDVELRERIVRLMYWVKMHWL